MILGAGPYQVPGIRRATELGLEAITVDYLPENVGHQHSQQSVNCSVLDKGGVLRAARNLAVDGIISLADMAMSTAASVAAELSLPGSPPGAVQILSDKAKFRAMQRAHGLHCPQFIAGDDWSKLVGRTNTLSPPLMFKPTDSRGSCGVSRIDVRDREREAEAFLNAQQHSSSKEVCVEEFVEGLDVSGDGFMFNEQLAFVLTTQKHARGYVPIGHSLPPSLASGDQQRVHAAVTAACQAAGYSDGPLDFDAVVSPDKVTIIEINPRLGGNGIPFLIAHSSGVNLLTIALRFAVGEPLNFTRSVAPLKGCGSWVFGSNRSGRLLRIASEAELKDKVPELLVYLLRCRIGEDVAAFSHSGKSLGFAVFDCRQPSDYDRTVDRIAQALQLSVQ